MSATENGLPKPEAAPDLLPDSPMEVGTDSSTFSCSPNAASPESSQDSLKLCRERDGDTDFSFTPVDAEWQESRAKATGFAIEKLHPDRAIIPQSSRNMPPKSRVKVVGDGNCFFRSITYLLTGSEHKHDVFRQEGTMPLSFRLGAIVSHIGSTSASGHYVCDVWSHTENAWKVCDDIRVSGTDEDTVRRHRRKTAYILFYIAREACETSLS